MNKLIYRFPTSFFYQNENLKRISEIMKGFGFDSDIGLGGDAGHYDVVISSKDGSDVKPLPDEAVEEMQRILQEVAHKITAEDESIKMTFKPGYLLKEEKRVA